MFDIFYNKRYDNKVALIVDKKTLTFAQVKAQIAYSIEQIKNKKENVVILFEDNYHFIINFLASLFGGKNIYLINDRTKLKTLNFDYDVLEKCQIGSIENYKFEKIDFEIPNINFYTSGSSIEPKHVVKTLKNMVLEAEMLKEELKPSKKRYTVCSTTSMCHLYGLTFHLFYAFINRYIIDTDTVTSPDDVDKKDVILISTPTFLRTVKKFDEPFGVSPKYIFSAGSKLSEEDFKLLEENSKIVEIYGSTETGVVAYKTHHNSLFKIFGDVKITSFADYSIIKSKTIFNGEVKIYDNLEIEGEYLKITRRTDRLFKIYEKRVSAEEIEYHLKESPFVDNCYLVKHKEKLACLCALSVAGRNFLVQNGFPLMVATLKAYLSEFSEIVPHNWKFIDILPMTPNGKIDKNAIEHIFKLNLSFPVIMNRKFDENTIEYKIFFYKQCNFFRGHFPEFKLLAGVVQIYFAKMFANYHFKLNVGCGQWKRIKFSNIIQPDSIITLRLTKTNNDVLYEYFSDTKKLSSGTFSCDNIFDKKTN